MALDGNTILANEITRNIILTQASRASWVIYSGKGSGINVQPLRNSGILTHLTIEGDFQNIENIKFADFNFYYRMNAKISAFPQHYGKLLLPVANVYFNPWHPDHFMVPDLRGAMYMDVIGAQAFVEWSGASTGMTITQHVFTNIPYHPNRGVLVPVLDLSIRNEIKDISRSS